MVVLNNTGAGSQLMKKPSVSGSTPKRPAPPRPSPGSKTPEKQNSDYQKKTTRWEMFTQPIEVFDFFFFLSKITHFTWWCSVDVSSSILPVWVHVIERIGVTHNLSPVMYIVMTRGYWVGEADVSTWCSMWKM